MKAIWYIYIEQLLRLIGNEKLCRKYADKVFDKVILETEQVLKDTIELKGINKGINMRTQLELAEQILQRLKAPNAKVNSTVCCIDIVCTRDNCPFDTGIECLLGVKGLTVKQEIAIAEKRIKELRGEY